MAASRSASVVLANMRTVLRTSQEVQRFYTNVKNIEIVEGDFGRCLASFKVEEEHCNILGTLHGGMGATLVDNVSSFALVDEDLQKSLPRMGVTVDLSLSYLAAARLGDELWIEGRVLKLGRKLAFLDCELRKKGDNSLVLRGSHTKSIVNEDNKKI